MYSIALVVPYFGRFNNYFDLWLKSCAANPTIDFLIFTDDKTKYEFPDNVHVAYMSFEYMKYKIQQNFKFQIVINSPYKLCDFKPTYGDVFETELQGYDFWGYCDTDLIFGDIRRFITDDVLASYDKILGCGHLTLMRNNASMNTLYRMSSEYYDETRYVEVFSNERNYAFDEYPAGGINDIVVHQGISFYQKMDFIDLDVSKYSFLNVVNRCSEKSMRATILKWDLDDNCKLRYYLVAQDGKSMTEQVALYAHMQKRPMTRTGIIKDMFLIVPNRFLPCETDVTPELVCKLGKKKLIYPHYFKIRLGNLKRKLRHAFRKITNRFE